MGLLPVEASDAIQAKDLKAFGCTVDVANRAQVEAAIGGVREKLGPRYMVTNAGIDANDAFTDITLESWNRVLTVRRLAAPCKSLAARCHTSRLSAAHASAR